MNIVVMKVIELVMVMLMMIMKVGMKILVVLMIMGRMKINLMRLFILIMNVVVMVVIIEVMIVVMMGMMMRWMGVIRVLVLIMLMLELDRTNLIQVMCIVLVIVVVMMVELMVLILFLIIQSKARVKYNPYSYWWQDLKVQFLSHGNQSRFWVICQEFSRAETSYIRVKALSLYFAAMRLFIVVKVVKLAARNSRYGRTTTRSKCYWLIDCKFLRNDYDVVWKYYSDCKALKPTKAFFDNVLATAFFNEKCLLPGKYIAIEGHSLTVLTS